MQHTNVHRRTSSGSTVKATLNAQPGLNSGTQHSAPPAQPVRATLWVHDDNFSTEDVLINEAILEGSTIKEGSLVEIYPAKEASDIRDFQSPNSENEESRRTPGDVEHTFDRGTRYLCIAKFAPAEFKAKQANLQVSIKSNLAQAFGLRSRSHVWILAASFEECTASHVEFSFRDVYLARSDMWRLVGQELAGRTVFAGQKITFMGSTKLTVKSIHVHGHKVPTAYFAGTTIPIFRSEAARYVLFIQMSSEMWDFDSEGHGEIMFNRVINGFLPDLFKRWHDLDVRHLVSIVLFGRLEYDRFDLARNKDRRLENSTASGGPNMTARQYQDFYRVVVTDMASAQWTTILDELKKDFRVFLRDISLHTSSSQGVDAGTASSATTRIAGRPSTALKGNILEAINIASNQFADDYIDRDLIRTGISVVVVTAGTGVFEVDRDLLNLTSQTLTNNGVGIDIVCLSKMPLHSVPLFKYRVTEKEDISFTVHAAELAESPRRSGSGPSFFDSSQPRKLSPALSSTATNSTRLLASYVSGHNGENASGWYFGIPQWIDLSYWSADAATTLTELAQESQQQQHPTKIVKRRKGPFVPRVRMYEIQMMGLMELDDLAVTGDTRADEAAESGSSVSSASDDGNDGDSTDQTGSWMGTSVASSVPKSNVPFIQNVNASNPLKRDPNRGSLFGKWQHLYPRKPRTATVKWRSLCTPASVPLTTEDFPSKHELDTEYEVASYDVKLGSTNQMLEIPESRDTLLQEMMALRFSHGYQLIVGQSLIEAVGPRTYDTSSFFTPDIVRPDGSFIFMSMGSTIQKISLEEADRVRVTKFVRKIPQVQPPFPQQLKYYPNIKTILSDTYNIRDLEFNSFTEQYPWEAADKYLADFTKQTEADIQALRFWRARFVLIPVEPPATARRPAPSDSEENEEEIHLRGIRALTQMWQKARYVPPDERRPVHNRLSTMKAKDRNPLRINLETLNPSELVATELDKLIAAEEAGELQTTQLLPEEEQFDRDSFNLAKLAQAIQSDKGIEIKNRRWHWRLHYSCFSGEDLTNWLVHNFRDIDTREEAVDFGNELMKEGLFEHVNSRHKFKDGNFFYSIKPEWRIQRPEARQSWFPASRRSDRSVPPTPISELPARELVSGRSRSGSNLAIQAQIGSELGKSLGDRKRRTVTLSKMIRIDVDHRKRSNRPEIINLHYDRLHNPENCYHLELSWFNVTSKLVDDAIVSWTTQAEKYGLKLVELPILEASKIPEHEPFRAPYRIKLSLEPPRRNSLANVYYTATSFGPQAALNSDIHLYQKALLKRFNFVLDLEAVSEFPENVEIQYSWGKLDYRYTQFVHRSGIVLAQITDEGDLLLLANRLYNSRQALTNQAVSRFDNIKKDATANLNSASGSTLLRPPIPASTHSAPPAPSMQASGIIGLNVQSPQTGPFASPLIRPVSVATNINTSLSLSNNNTSTSNSNTDSNSPANNSTSTAAGGDHLHYHQIPPQQQPQVIADVFGAGAGGIGSGGGGGSSSSSNNRRCGLVRSGIAQYVTPEQIKDELEAFCQDRDRLDAFFREVTATLPAQQAALKERERERGKAGNSGGTSSSLLRPIREPESERGIPEFNLPEAISVTLKKGSGRIEERPV
ncbi:hypothetical protein KCU88_g7096, partial [Aureobasidium melanogenum]